MLTSLQNKTASALLRPDCAVSGLLSTIGKPDGPLLRYDCAKSEIIIFLALCVLAVAILWTFGLPKWSVLLPVWITLGYAVVYVPLQLMVDNSSDLAFQASGLTKTEWLSIVTADQRTRLTVFASISAAIIVSANAWLSRWESSKSKAAEKEAQAKL